MKKILWIACLLLVMPFLGYSQKHAGFATQNDEAIFGPGPVSKELHSKVLNNRDIPTDVWAHAMFVPEKNHNYGYYYAISDENGTSIEAVKMYDNFYFGSAEYYKPYPSTDATLDETFPVWAYAADQSQGFHRVNYQNGGDNESFNNPTERTMRELAYDYYHDAFGHQGRMLGMEYGKIYIVNTEWSTGASGTTDYVLYDPTDPTLPEYGKPRPITLACNLAGEVYFVSISENGTDLSDLYMFEADDENLDDPILIGSVNWPAQHVQTMAFDHNDFDRLFWWQCDKDNNTNMVEIDVNTGATTLKFATGKTEMAGLIFEFEYIDHIAYCVAGEGGVIYQNKVKTDGTFSGNYTETTQPYKPAKLVKFEVANDECYMIDAVNVYKRNADGTNGDVLYTFAATDLTLVGGKYRGEFAMPAFDVNIVGTWSGIEHNVNLVVVPSGHAEWLTLSGSASVGNGETVTVTYEHPAGWFLANLVAKKGTVNVPVTVNKTASTASFTMPCGDVTVTATYKPITLDDIYPICQWQGILDNPANHIPESPHMLTEAHAHIFTFTDPTGAEHTYQNTEGLYGPAAYTEMDNILAGLTFDIVGTWYYTTWFTSQKYGAFPTVTKSFQVYAAPKSISIKEVIGDYNAHYNCDGDSIHLEVVADPSDYVWNGSFEWKKDGAPLITTTEPLLVINPCTVADAGNYEVTYIPNTGETTATAAPCDFDLPEPFKVNVATIPNNPEIVLDGPNPICYHSAATLRWNYGVLKPDAYDIKWFKLDGTGKWELLEGESDIEFTTPVLDAAATYGLSISYAEPGHYYLCHSDTTDFVVNVKNETVLTILGDSTTCRGFVPDVNPYIDNTAGTFTSFKWTFNSILLDETSNTLHFENATHEGTPVNLLNTAGKFWIEVEAQDAEGECTIYGEAPFRVKELPALTITNDKDPEVVAHVGDNPIAEIEICAGEQVELTGNGATDYVWGEGLDATHGPVFIAKPTETTIYSMTGTDGATTCWNTVSIKIIVHPRPVITWVKPEVDGMEFSMLLDEYQLEATPAGGEFTWIDPLDPTGIGHVIEGGLLKPSELGVGTYQLVYRYTDEFGCSNEDRVRNITITKEYWSDTKWWNPNWFDHCVNDLGRFEITTPNDMGSFWAYVYGLNGVTKTDFAGDTIWVYKDINLAGVFSRPFTNECPFHGVFDGNGHVLSNMTILEDNLTMNVDGFIRNVGVRDAKVTSVGNPCVVDVVAGGRFHNSYITMPTLNNVAPKLMPFGTAPILPTGEVRNVYYYGLIPNLPDEYAAYASTPLPVYMESTETPKVQLYPAINPLTLCHPAVENYDNYSFEGILEEWVWFQNDYYYRMWKTDAANPEDYKNYGYPVHTDAYHHHHYINVDICDEIADYTMTGVKEHTYKGHDYTYAKNDDVITMTFTPNKYVLVDEVVLNITGYHGTETKVITVPVVDNVATFTMPKDSLYMPAYEMSITVDCRRDYWTDEGNYNPNWWNHCVTDLGKFEIVSPRDLAAFAHACLFEHKTFQDTTVYILGAEGSDKATGTWLLDMTGHFWLPVQNFKGTLDGTHFIVDNLYIREQLNAMFVNLEGTVRNLGVQDVDLPADDEMGVDDLKATMFVNETGYAGSWINGFATYDPALHQFIPMALGDAVTVTNCYTLDEGGNPKDFNGNGTDLGMLQAWVIEKNSEDFWPWRTDFATPINYNYPIHQDHKLEIGYKITYVPSITEFSADPSLDGYVDGPMTALAGQTISVGVYPKACYNNCETLNCDGTDILSTHTFTMPDHDVTVTATFAPIMRNLTINYIVDDDPTLVPAPVHAQYVYNDPYTHTSPTTVPAGLEDYEPEIAVVEGNMPCNDLTVDVHYLGKFHDINFCEDLLAQAASVTTDHYDATLDVNRARFHDNVHVDVVAPAGLSIPDDKVTFEKADGTPISFTGSNGHYDFEMPEQDVVICLEFDYEYWDDYGIADIDWFIGHEDDDTYVLTKDSMLGGLAALTTGRPWLVDEGYYTAEQVATFDFTGKTILVESAQEEGMIDLIEHKWRPIGAQVDYLKYFQGYFDGQNTEIVNMNTIDTTWNGSCQAFFGNVGDAAIITNLHIQGVATGRYYTAGIAGVNYGLIMNSVATVKVRSEFEAGGIAGNNLGVLVNDYCNADTIYSMTAKPLTKDGGLEDNNYYIGGVAASNSGIIDNCHSVAFLYRGGTGSGPWSMGSNPINFFGGVIGWNFQNGANCYWTVNPIVEGVGGGNALENSNSFDAATSAATATAMNARSLELPAYVESLGSVFDQDWSGLTFNGWKNGAEYPVFALDRIIMSNSENGFEVSLYPNPTKDVVYIFSENIQNVTVFNMFGQMVLDTKVNANQTSINMSGFASGIYMVRITTSNGVTTRNLVVE